MLSRLRLALLLVALCGPAHAAGIVFSGAADLGNNNGNTSSLTVSYTVGSSSNRALVLCMVGATTATATYNGVSMTQQVIDSQRNISIYYLLNPASGANTLFLSTGITIDYIQVIAADYSNVRQTGQPDGSGISDDGIVADTYSGTYSTAQSGATVIGCASGGGGSIPTVSGSFTRRTYAAQFGNTLLADTGPVIPSGSVTLAATIGNEGAMQSQAFLSLISVPGGGSFMLNGVGH